ncbi:MAG: ribonuclease HII, partial [Parcubacteria group bacterium]
MKKSTFEWERELLEQQEFSFVIGIDEAGRGPLAGPVVASAA